MAAMKPRTGDGPLEVTKEGRGIVMRVPLEGGGRLVVELNATEARELGEALTTVVSCRSARDPAWKEHRDRSAPCGCQPCGGPGGSRPAARDGPAREHREHTLVDGGRRRRGRPADRTRRRGRRGRPAPYGYRRGGGPLRHRPGGPGRTGRGRRQRRQCARRAPCLLYTSDAADE